MLDIKFVHIVLYFYFQNFYLIDPYLLLFLGVLMSRRLVWCFVQEVLTYMEYAVLSTYYIM